MGVWGVRCGGGTACRTDSLEHRTLQYRFTLLTQGCCHIYPLVPKTMPYIESQETNVVTFAAGQMPVRQLCRGADARASPLPRCRCPSFTFAAGQMPSAAS